MNKYQSLILIIIDFNKSIKTNGQKLVYTNNIIIILMHIYSIINCNHIQYNMKI